MTPAKHAPVSDPPGETVWSYGDGSGPEDQQTFRRVMGKFATGITVITTVADGETAGMTANAFMAGSLEPPLCMVSIGKRARMHGLLKRSGFFCVSLLSRDQWHLSSHFGGKPTEGLTPEFGELGGRPVLERSLATVSADIESEAECGDHTIFIGRIVQTRHRDHFPLLFFDGRYAQISGQSRIEDSESLSFW